MLGPDPPTAAPPTADALDASVRLARLRQQMFAQVETPRIAQYHVLRQIGGGGMGLVFAAWDPALDRVIAIKVLRDPWAAGGDALRREAVALARLRHPNVVSVFEVAEHAGQVYLAMEYIEGETLRAWAKRWHAAPRRDTTEFLRVFGQIAEGLAAAHAAGLVHRDVKPENVMLDRDGRVRVMDFGLARAEARATEHDTGRVSSAGTTTNSGGLVGTPAYMAPEQFEGSAPGPAADQFAMVACMFEALYGRRLRPPRIDAAAIAAAAPVQLPRDRRVPRRMQALLRRGLATAPGDRWPSMQALADEMRAMQRPAWIRWAALGGVVIATIGVVAGIAVADPQDAVCTGSDALMVDVWDSDRAAALVSRADTFDVGFAADAMARLVPKLDAYRGEWIATHLQTCEAAQRRREITQTQMDLRMACLDDRRQHLGALVDVIERGDAEALSLADEAAAGLPNIAACIDAAYVARQGYRPGAEAAARAVDERVARADAELSAGAITDARASALAAFTEAEAHGDGVAMARAGFALGRAQAALFESQEAYATLVAAYEHARREQLSDIAVEIASELTGLTGVELSRTDEGQWWLRIAELDGAGIDDPRLHVRRQLAAAAMLEAAGRTREALARAEAAFATLRDEVHADADALALAELSVGRLLLGTGEVERGSATISRAAASLREVLGDAHLSNARAERALGRAARFTGDFEQSNRHFDRALLLGEATFGPNHIALAPLLESVATARGRTGRVDEGLAAIDRALALQHPRPLHGGTRAHLYGIRGDLLSRADPAGALVAREQAYALALSAYGDQHRATVRYLAALGESLGANGRSPEAIEKIGLALATGRAVFGSGHPDLASIHNSLAIEYERQGQHERALEHHVAQLELLERDHGEKSAVLAGACNNVCTGLIRLERPGEAIPYCRRAVAISEATNGESPTQAAELRNTLGVVLMMNGELDEAERVLDSSRALWRSALGADSVEESSPILNQGELLQLRGDTSGACRHFREALRIRVLRLGAADPSTEWLRSAIAKCEG